MQPMGRLTVALHGQAVLQTLCSKHHTVPPTVYVLLLHSISKMGVILPNPLPQCRYFLLLQCTPPPQFAQVAPHLLATCCRQGRHHWF